MKLFGARDDNRVPPLVTLTYSTTEDLHAVLADCFKPHAKDPQDYYVFNSLHDDKENSVLVMITWLKQELCWICQHC